MEINGLPAHALVIHTAVVFGPLSALGALVYVLVPSWRDRLRIPMAVLAVIGTLAVVAAYITGDNLLGRNPQLAQLPEVQTHQDRALVALWVTSAFGVIALGAAWLHRRTGVVRVLVGGLLGVAAVAVIVSVVLTGDAGARAVWGGVN